MFVCKCLAELKKSGLVWLNEADLNTDGVVVKLLCGLNREWDVNFIFNFFFIDLKLLSSLLISANLGEGWIGDNPFGNYESGECHSVHSKCQTPQV